jgi:predicted DCC family thiol-disulfide oxidoreductase YuxK
MEPTAILLYDGECLMCSRFVQFILRHEANEKIYFSAIQSAIGQSIKKKHHLPEQYADSIVFIVDQQVFIKSAAVIKIAKYLDWPYRLLYYLSHFTIESLNNFFYDWIARNRYRFFGKSSACEQINPKYLHRFIS